LAAPETAEVEEDQWLPVDVHRVAIQRQWMRLDVPGTDVVPGMDQLDQRAVAERPMVQISLVHEAAIGRTLLMAPVQALLRPLLDALSTFGRVAHGYETGIERSVFRHLAHAWRVPVRADGDGGASDLVPERFRIGEKTDIRIDVDDQVTFRDTPQRSAHRQRCQHGISVAKGGEAETAGSCGSMMANWSGYCC